MIFFFETIKKNDWAKIGNQANVVPLHKAKKKVLAENETQPHVDAF